MILESQPLLARPGMAITLNGIAQGFGADRACEAMRVAGVAARATQADAWSTAIMVGGDRPARHALARGEMQRVRPVDKQGRASRRS